MGLNEKLGIDIFHQEVIHKIAESADVSETVLETLDERGLNTLEHWISSLVHERHLWPDRYMQHLMKVIGTIGNHGRAVIVGRGANFILPADKRNNQSSTFNVQDFGQTGIADKALLIQQTKEK